MEKRDLGRVLGNDGGVVTQRDPDTVRGANVAYYSYDRLPRGPLPEGYPDQAPEIVIEVLSPSDRWPKVLEKVAEHLNAGVLAVALIAPRAREAHVYRQEEPPIKLTADDSLEFPGILPGFEVVVGRLFA